MRATSCFSATLLSLLLCIAGWRCKTEATIFEQLNEPPRISAIEAGRHTLFIRDRTRITCRAMDPDGDSLSYQWQTSENSIEGEGSSIIWWAPEVSAEYRVTCSVRDKFGGMDKEEITLYVFNYDSLEFETLDRLIHLALWVPQRAGRVFRSRDEWAMFWSGYRRDTRELPEIDFNRKTVIGAFWGKHSGCGNYHPTFIPSVGTSGDTVYVQVNFPKRGNFGGCDAEITPMHLISIKKTELPVKLLVKTTE